MKTQNTFADGINMDVNPLVAPKTVMSNCLNGTLITYNGNENVLQNDMGNGKVGSAYLPTGWVPVGMQEYGGIIYVAAYNPETKESQLGSFPSPLQNFENSNNADSISFLLKEGKYPLFNDKELQLKPGNKLAIALASNLYEKVEKNFNNTNTEHKKRWSIRLCLLTSNGVLTDVTDNLSNLTNPSKIDKKDKYNDFFFLENTAGSLENYLRIYSGTLVGTPYIQVAENLASSMDVEVLPGYDLNNNTVTFKVKCTITSSSLLIGYKDENFGLKGIYWKVSESWTGQGTRFSGLLAISDISNIQDGLEYTIGVEGLIEIPNVYLLPKDNDIILEIYPNFEWENAALYPLYSLMYKQTFDVSKIGTGLHKINLWRYYYDEDFITLTWGMESYPALGEEVKEVNMRFIGYDGNPVNFGNTILTFKRSTFNGEFTEVLDSLLFTYKFPYIVEITWQAGTRNFLECRWIIPTPLYNDFYLSKRILDFYHPEGLYTKDFNAVKVIEGNVLQFSEKPLEQVIDLGWEYFPIVSKKALSDKTITYTKIYQYTPKARLKVVQSSDYYPFEVNYSNVRNIRINDSLASSISNYLITPHDIRYEKVSNINVSKLFECHNEDFLNNYTGYMIFGVTRFRHKSSSDENRLTMYAYNNKGELVIDPKYIITEASDSTIRFNLNDYWSSTIKIYLDNLQSLTDLFVIPILFFAEKATGVYDTSVSNRPLGLNYAIKKDEEWHLYWNKEKWIKVSNWWDAKDDYDLLRYNHLKNWFHDTPNTVYENRINLPKPLPYLRCVSNDGLVVNGWLVRNNSTNVTQDSEEEFKFNVKVDASLRIVTTIDGKTDDYNTILQEFVNRWEVQHSESVYITLAITLGYKLIEQLKFNANSNVTVEQDYEFINTRVGTYELHEELENYRNYGINTLVLYNNEYISPKEELDADGVYLYENGHFLDVTYANTDTYKSFRYIVGNKSSVHYPTELAAIVDEDSIKVNLVEIPTFDGAEIFKFQNTSSDSSSNSGNSSSNETSSYGTPYDSDGDGVIDYWILQQGYYSNGNRRLLRGIDTDEDGIPDKWYEINPPRNE